MPFKLRSKLIELEDNWKKKKRKGKETQLRIAQGEVTFGVSIEGNLLPAEAHGNPLEKRADACIEQVRVYVVLFHQRSSSIIISGRCDWCGGYRRVATCTRRIARIFMYGPG